MKSKWESIKPQAIELRKQGNSIPSISRDLGIPLSTLSGWLKNIELTPEQRENLDSRWREDLQKARVEAIKWHNAGKEERLESAAQQAKAVLEKIPNDNEVLELALAFLYLGEGSKNNNTSLGSSNPTILRFYIASIQHLYKVPIEKIKCYLHLRADQNDVELKEYWATELNLSLENFGKTSFDKRTVGRGTYPDYKGVCIVECGRVEIQRRLMYIANGYCDKMPDKVTEGG
jgi:hypothetical protein